MTDQDLLAMLKVDLGYNSSGQTALQTAINTRLTQLLSVAESEIKAKGAKTLDKTKLDDAQIIVMYAAWLWRNRGTQNEMPRMVRCAVNDRVFSEKMRAES